MDRIPSFSRCLVAALGGASSLALFPSEGANYTAAIKPYNLDIQVAPAAIVFPETTSQVAGVVRCAAQAGVKVQPRCGGHNYGNYGSATGQLSVHLDKLRSFSMDQSTWKAKVGGGMLLGGLNEALWNAGQRYVPHGLSFSIGVGGHATVGGIGITSRSAGLLTDHIVEAEVVLADGSVVRASEKQHAPLFFAIRGAAASFGIVTEFVFQTNPAPPSIINYSFVWTVTDAASRAQILKDYQKWLRTASPPNELSSTLTIAPAVVVVAGGFLGTLAQFQALNLSSYYPPAQAATADVYTSYRDVSVAWNAQMEQSGIAAPSPFYAKSLLFGADAFLTDAVVDKLFSYMATTNNGTDFFVANFELGGGVLSNVPSNATAFPHRQAVFAMLTQGICRNGVTRTTVDFLNGLSNLIINANPHAYYGEYAGYVDPKQDDKEARKNYWGDNLPRLRKIKAKVDFDDVFHNQQSVTPSKK